MFQFLEFYVSDFWVWLQITIGLIVVFSFFTAFLRSRHAGYLDIPETLTQLASYAVLFTVLTVLAVIVLTVLAIIVWVCLSVWGTVTASSLTSNILKNAEASATLVAVVFTGFFGFLGIIITSFINAKNDRDQTAYNEKKLMEFRRDLSKGLENQIGRFSSAFERYHKDTLRAIELTEKRRKEDEAGD